MEARQEIKIDILPYIEPGLYDLTFCPWECEPYQETWKLADPNIQGGYIRKQLNPNIDDEL